MVHNQQHVELLHVHTYKGSSVTIEGLKEAAVKAGVVWAGRRSRVEDRQERQVRVRCGGGQGGQKPFTGGFLDEN